MGDGESSLHDLDKTGITIPAGLNDIPYTYMYIGVHYSKATFGYVITYTHHDIHCNTYIYIYIYLGVAITAGLAQASNCPWVLALESSSGAGFGSVTSCNHQGLSNTRDIYWDIYGIRYLYMVCIWFSMVLNYISKKWFM